MMVHRREKMSGKNFNLKRLTTAGIGAALKKAERYRLLNEPEHAESICLDILSVDKNNQEALQNIILAIADQFRMSGEARPRRALEYAAMIEDEYQRLYLTGLVHEREGRSLLRRAIGARSAAYECFRAAMDAYASAEAIRPEGIDDTILRWNSCVRIIQREALEPARYEMEMHLE